MSAAVLIENLRKSYGAVQAVKDISFTVQPGEIFGLLGPNGAGKTTTIRCLCTLAKADGGSIEVGGVSAIASPKAVRQRLGYVAQEVAIDKVLTVAGCTLPFTLKINWRSHPTINGSPGFSGIC
jgi:ABC-2 type transport system ATP-binding protein